MQRRDFLQLLGLTAAAAALGPSVLVEAAAPVRGVLPARDLLVTRYPLHVPPNTLTGVSAYILEAPADTLCRAVFEIPVHCEPDVHACVFGMLSGNDFAQVVINRVGFPGEPNRFAGIVDACIFNTLDGYCPVDSGAVHKGRPLEIDYEAFTGWGDQHLMLALWHQNVDDSWSHGGFPGPIGMRKLGPAYGDVSEMVRVEMKDVAEALRKT